MIQDHLQQTGKWDGNTVTPSCKNVVSFSITQTHIRSDTWTTCIALASTKLRAWNLIEMIKIQEYPFKNT